MVTGVRFSEPTRKVLRTAEREVDPEGEHPCFVVQVRDWRLAGVAGRNPQSCVLYYIKPPQPGGGDIMCPDRCAVVQDRTDQRFIGPHQSLLGEAPAGAS